MSLLQRILDLVPEEFHNAITDEFETTYGTDMFDNERCILGFLSRDDLPGMGLDPEMPEEDLERLVLNELQNFYLNQEGTPYIPDGQYSTYREYLIRIIEPLLDKDRSEIIHIVRNTVNEWSEDSEIEEIIDELA